MKCMICQGTGFFEGYPCAGCFGCTPEFSARQSQVGGDHCRNMKIQPVEFITANSIPYLEGNVIKYICRHRSKGGAEDLKKARHYIDLLLQHEYPDDTN